MRKSVTVVPSDNLIIVDNEALRFNYTSPTGIHAIQWNDTYGHIERDNEANLPISGEEGYNQVLPFVELWECEKERVLKERAEFAAKELEKYNSDESRAARLRVERDSRIAKTDYAMSSDYPMDPTRKQIYTVYRQALRDITKQPGFPWNGGGTDDPSCPWPRLGSM